MSKFTRTLVHRIRSVFVFFVASIVLVILLLAVGWALDLNVVGWLLSSATPVVKVLGDRLPVLSTPFGRIQLRSHETPKGLEVVVTCADCQLKHRYLSREPFRTANAIITGIVKGKHFTGTAEVEGLSVPLDVQWDGATTRGNATLPKHEIKDVYHALRTIVPEVDQATITGTVSGRGTFVWPDLQVVFDPVVSDFTVDGLVDQESYTKGKFTYTAKDSSGAEIQVESGEGSPSWLPLAAFGSYLPDAVLAVEDQGFYQHAGFSVKSMVDATRFNKREGAVKRGGSSLTQQLAKNLFLSDERTYSRKFRELLYAVEMDRELGKNRILELYLNIVEWGPSIFGAQAAAKVYFNKAPSDLLPEEAAWLATILRSPKRAYETQFLRRRVHSGLVEYALGRMTKISEEERAAALRRTIEFAAPKPAS